MYIVQAINTITNKCARICKQTYRKLTQYKIHTLDTLKNKWNIEVIDNMNSVNTYIKAAQQRYKITQNVYVNICTYDCITMLEDITFENRKYNINVANKQKLFQHTTNKHLCLITEHIFYNDDTQLPHMQIFHNSDINKRFIPIIDELFKSKTIIFLIFSDENANIIGINKVSYNSMYDTVN